jgi:hypothetical protein
MTGKISRGANFQASLNKHAAALEADIRRAITDMATLLAA